MGGGSGAGGGGGANRRYRVEISRWRRAVLLVPVWNCMSERCGREESGERGGGKEASFVRENKSSKLNSPEKKEVGRKKLFKEQR